MKLSNYLFMVLVSIGILGILVSCQSQFNSVEQVPNLKKKFWNTQRRGTNFFSKTENFERFQVAKEFGIEFVRLAPSKWLNGRPESERGDFLVGKKGPYNGLVQKDVARLKEVLSFATKSNMKVVLTMLSLPYRRWSQHNKGLGQERLIWKDFKYQNHAITFWKDLAEELKDHPAIVGYNIINEPVPERLESNWAKVITEEYDEYFKRVKGTPADLNLFYKKIIKAIRSVDKKTPIILDSGNFAKVDSLKGITPQKDDNILYSVHMYTPYAYTLGNQGNHLTYPGKVKYRGKIIQWNKERLLNEFKQIIKWQKKNNILSRNVLIGEFGVRRGRMGAEKYLSDLIDIFEKEKWHWAFYSFRSDDWDKLNYEFGPGKKAPPGFYRDQKEKAPFPGKKSYKKNKLFDVLLKNLK